MQKGRECSQSGSTWRSSPPSHWQPDTANVQYKGEKDGDWYKLSKKDGSATGFYLAELKCPNSYYDDDHPENHYCAMEFRCYLDDSATGFTYTLHDDC